MPCVFDSVSVRVWLTGGGSLRGSRGSLAILAWLRIAFALLGAGGLGSGTVGVGPGLLPAVLARLGFVGVLGERELGEPGDGLAIPHGLVAGRALQGDGVAVDVDDTRRSRPSS